MFTYYSTESEFLKTDKTEEGTSYAHNKKFSDMTQAEREKKRTEMMSRFSKSALTTLVGLKEAPKDLLNSNGLFLIRGLTLLCESPIPGFFLHGSLGVRGVTL